MRQYGMKSGKEYKPEVWKVAKARSDTLIITPDDAEFERTTREEKAEEGTPDAPDA